MVGVARLELAASWSRTMRATICATPRCSFFIIMRKHTVVKYHFSFLQRNINRNRHIAGLQAKYMYAIMKKPLIFVRAAHLPAAAAK